jgi:hypothetical protein
MNQATKSELSIPALLSSLVGETGVLVRQEVRLASTEMGQKARRALVDLGFVGLGGALAHAGLLAFIAAVILGFGTLMPMWGSALGMGVIAAASGGLLVRKGLKALQELDPIPQRTVDTLQQDKTWLKEQIR